MILRVLLSTSKMVSVEKSKVPMYLYFASLCLQGFPGGWTELPLYDTVPLHQVLQHKSFIINITEYL